MRARTISACFALVAVLPALGYGASFDCHKATTPAEKLVCSSSEVRILDVQLYETYQRAQRLSANRDAIRNQQRHWLKESRNTCKTIECLAQVYTKRISELTAEIHYSECEGDHGELTGTSLMVGYCNARGKTETENTIADLISLISSRYTADQITRFKALQSDWKKNVQCNCFQEVGVGSGPGWSRGLLNCEIRETDQRLLEIREIAAGLQDLEYGRTGLKSCAEIRAEKEADPEYQMIQAITKNDINTVKTLLKQGTRIPPGDYSYTPIDIATRNNNNEMLSFLLANGADPKRDIEAMKAALQTCNIKAVSLLVDHGYQVKGTSKEGFEMYDPLPWAALHGCTDIIKYLVSKGAVLLASKPLRRAAQGCHVETVKYLLEKGHDPNATDMWDPNTHDFSKDPEYKPLWVATRRYTGTPDKQDACNATIKFLLRAGATPNRELAERILECAKDDKGIATLLRKTLENGKQ